MEDLPAILKEQESKISRGGYKMSLNLVLSLVPFLNSLRCYFFMQNSLNRNGFESYHGFMSISDYSSLKGFQGVSKVNSFRNTSVHSCFSLCKRAFTLNRSCAFNTVY